MERKITTLLPSCLYIIAVHLVCRCSLPVWRRSFLKKGTPVTYFGPALDPPLGGSGRKTTTLVRDHGFFIPIKFHQNPSSGSGEEVENVKSLRTPDDRRRTDRRTDDGRCAMTKAQSSLWLRWAKKKKRGGGLVQGFRRGGQEMAFYVLHNVLQTTSTQYSVFSCLNVLILIFFSIYVYIRI